MNVRGMASVATNTVNECVPVTLRKSSGYTIASGRRQVPAYEDPISGYAKVQALDGKDLKQMDGINTQGTCRAIYLQGNLAGVIRPKSQGGDIIEFNGEQWLVVKVLESWPSWTKCAIVLQGLL